MRSYLKAGVFLVVVALLAACSSEKVNEPLKLVDFKPSLKIEKVWSESVGDGSDGEYLSLTPAVLEDRIYAVDLNGEVTALDRLTGDEKWNVSLDLPVSGGLGVDAQHLYLATMHGEVIALDRANGKVQWRQQVTSEVITAPISNGKIVVAQSIDGKLFAFDVKTGKQVWRFDSIVPVLSLRGTTSPVVSDTYTVSGFANGEIVAIDNQTGVPYWSRPVGVPKGRTELERLVDIDGRSAVQDGRLYTVSYQGKLSVIDLLSGQEVWSTPQSSYTGVALGYTHVYVTSEDGKVVAYKETSPDKVWTSDLLKFRRLSTPVTFQETVVVADFEGYLHFLSQIDGSMMAREKIDSDGEMGYMVAVDDMLYVYSHSGELYAFRIKR
jgi:outer membrane protein assembly factor BamB